MEYHNGLSKRGFVPELMMNNILSSALFTAIEEEREVSRSFSWGEYLHNLVIHLLWHAVVTKVNVRNWPFVQLHHNGMHCTECVWIYDVMTLSARCLAYQTAHFAPWKHKSLLRHFPPISNPPRHWSSLHDAWVLECTALKEPHHQYSLTQQPIFISLLLPYYITGSIGLPNERYLHGRVKIDKGAAGVYIQDLNRSLLSVLCLLCYPMKTWVVGKSWLSNQTQVEPSASLGMFAICLVVHNQRFIVLWLAKRFHHRTQREML